jgi:hypothetical protein
MMTVGDGTMALAKNLGWITLAAVFVAGALVMRGAI